MNIIKQQLIQKQRLTQQYNINQISRCKQYNNYFTTMNKIKTEQEGSGFYLCQIKNSDLACYSYYLESQKECLIIDPVFDTQIYDDLIKKRQSSLKYIVMTHYHADFISGHLQFKAPIIMGQEAKKTVNKFQLTQLKQGQKLKLGDVQLVSIHTPGHTPQSTTYLLNDNKKQQICLFTGDTLFLGEVGRPDLSTQQGLTKIDLAGMMYDSLQKLKKYNDSNRIYPAHGSGSSCSGSTIQEGDFSTLAEQKKQNKYMKYQSKNQLISNLIQNTDQPPKYYFFDAKTNQKGPRDYNQQFKKLNNPLSVQEFIKLQKSCKLFDTRPKTQGGTIKGSYWAHGQGNITQWITITSTPEDKLLIVTQKNKAEQTLQRILRIGYFHVQGYNDFKVSEYTGEKIQLQLIKGQQALKIKDRTHIDVRGEQEWKKTGIIQGALTIPVKQVKDRLNQIKGKDNIIINCKTGKSARFAQSILAINGIKSFTLDQNVKDFQKLGFKVVPFIKQQNK